MTDLPHREPSPDEPRRGGPGPDTIPLPAAPVAEEWEPFLRAVRPTDNRPVIFTERQIARMQYILAAALDHDSPDRDAALQQLGALEAFLGAVRAESTDGPAAAPHSGDRWSRIDAQPYYLQPSSHARRLEQLRRHGLDPYGKPLTD